MAVFGGQLMRGLQKFAKFDSNLGGLRERIWQPALLLVSANRSCGRIHAAWSRWRVFCSGACSCCSGFFGFFVYHLNKQFLIPRFSHADSWLVATTRFCTAISVSTAWGWGYNSIFRCSRSRLFFCAASLLLLEVAAVVETTLFVFLCLRKAY